MTARVLRNTPKSTAAGEGGRRTGWAAPANVKKDDTTPVDPKKHTRSTALLADINLNDTPSSPTPAAAATAAGGSRASARQLAKRSDNVDSGGSPGTPSKMSTLQHLIDAAAAENKAGGARSVSDENRASAASNVPLTKAAARGRPHKSPGASKQPHKTVPKATLTDADETTSAEPRVPKKKAVVDDTVPRRPRGRPRKVRPEAGAIADTSTTTTTTTTTAAQKKRVRIQQESEQNDDDAVADSAAAKKAKKAPASPAKRPSDDRYGDISDDISDDEVTSNHAAAARELQQHTYAHDDGGREVQRDNYHVDMNDDAYDVRRSTDDSAYYKRYNRDDVRALPQYVDDDRSAFYDVRYMPEGEYYAPPQPYTNAHAYYAPHAAAYVDAPEYFFEGEDVDMPASSDDIRMRSGRLTPPLERDVTLGRASAHERVRRVADLALRVRARAGVDAHRRAPSAIRLGLSSMRGMRELGALLPAHLRQPQPMARRAAVVVPRQQHAVQRGMPRAPVMPTPIRIDGGVARFERVPGARGDVRSAELLNAPSNLVQSRVLQLTPNSRTLIGNSRSANTFYVTSGEVLVDAIPEGESADNPNVRIVSRRRYRKGDHFKFEPGERGFLCTQAMRATVNNTAIESGSYQGDVCLRDCEYET